MTEHTHRGTLWAFLYGNFLIGTGILLHNFHSPLRALAC
jgi:hypothetical protein